MEIMYINQKTLLTTIDNDTPFFGLVTLGNRIKE